MTSSNKQVRTALIGYGVAGSVFHAPLIHHTEDMILSAIVTANPQRQQSAAEAYPSCQIIRSADEIWSQPEEFDLVVIATPNETHAPLAEAAMKKGLAVVVDKPFAVSVEEGKHLLSVQQKTGALLSVFHNRRWDCDFLAIKELVDSHRVGNITRFESRFERYRLQPKPGAWRETTEAEAGGGLLFDLGSHLIDQALCLFGDPISVYAEVKTRRAGVRADDDTFVALEFANDVCVHLWVSMLSRVPGPRFRLMGTIGTYEKFGLDPQEEALRNGFHPGDKMWGLEPAEKAGRLTTTIGNLEFTGAMISPAGCYEQFYWQMRDAITSGANVPVRPEDAVKVLEIIEAARKSGKKRATVSL